MVPHSYNMFKYIHVYMYVYFDAEITFINPYSAGTEGD